MKITPYKFRRYLWVNRETLCLLVPNTNHHGKNWKDHAFLKKKKIYYYYKYVIFV